MVIIIITFLVVLLWDAIVEVKMTFLGFLYSFVLFLLIFVVVTG